MRCGLVLCTLLLWCPAMAQPAEAPPGEPAPGISQALAAWRGERYRDARYRIRFEIEPSLRSIRGEVELSVVLSEATDLILDWRPAQFAGVRGTLLGPPVVNGDAAETLEPRNEHLVIPHRLLRTGENRVLLRFASPVGTAGTAVTRFHDSGDGADYLYSLFVPSEASTLLPCLDQPDLKARFTLSLTIPAGWEAVGNMPQRQRHEQAGTATVEFEETPPISTYVFAFAAGPFAMLRDDASGTRLFVRASRLARAREESHTLLDLNRAGLRYLEQWFGMPYPFPKYDLVLIPELAYSGMEHAGATFLREDSILFPFVPSQSDRLRRAQLIFHEATHQWFGDLVTMRWFDDLWLKEGFANLMAFEAVAALLSEHDAWNAFRALKVSAYRTDATRGTTPIWQALPNLSAAKSAYGSIVYSKAPAVLRQAQAYLGEVPFREAVRDFLRRHAWGAASWEDLVSAFEKASGRDLGRWAQDWVRHPGLPRVQVEIEDDGEGHVRRLALLQSGEDVNASWPQAVRLVLVDAEGAREIVDVRIEGRITQVARVTGRRVPRLVFANYQDLGYGLFLLDEASRRVLLERAVALDEPFLRALLWDALWESVREGALPPIDWVRWCLRTLPEERDELTASALLGQMQTAMRWYLADEVRAALQPAVESVLRQGMLGADALSQRISYFRAFAALAQSENARGDLVGLLQGELQVPGLELRLADRYRLLRSLLAQADDRALALLSREAKADTSDEGRRFAWTAEAARPDPQIKRRYFEAFLRDTALPERWIEEALLPFNTVEQDGLTLAYLPDALRALPGLKRERRIFFVNDWLAAFIGGQRSPEALRIVQAFLQQNDLDADLRRKVLEVTDALERTVSIRQSTR
jgi:aminopeptidase N